MAEHPAGVIREVVVSDDDSGQRLDAFLAEAVEDLSRSQIQKLIKDGQVLLNEKTCRPKDPVTTGDRISFLSETVSRPLMLTPAPVVFIVLYEDDDLIVIDKPKGLVVHPGAGTVAPTLVEGLLHYWGQKAPLGNLRPGIVHRLDKDTTGVMVCAKTDAALAQLAKQFRDKSNLREYVALLDGVMLNEEIIHESYLYRDPRHRLRFASLPKLEYERLTAKEAASGYRYAKSKFSRQKVYADRLTLARVRLFTGRTHQIRIHAKDLKLPIVGDLLYHHPIKLSGDFPKEIREKIAALPDQLLHARVLGFEHPRSGEKMAFEAALPTEFRELLEVLEDYCR